MGMKDVMGKMWFISWEEDEEDEDMLWENILLDLEITIVVLTTHIKDSLYSINA